MYSPKSRGTPSHLLLHRDSIGPIYHPTTLIKAFTTCQATFRRFLKSLHLQFWTFFWTIYIVKLSNVKYGNGILLTNFRIYSSPHHMKWKLGNKNKISSFKWFWSTYNKVFDPMFWAQLVDVTVEVLYFYLTKAFWMKR